MNDGEHQAANNIKTPNACPDAVSLLMPCSEVFGGVGRCFMVLRGSGRGGLGGGPNEAMGVSDALQQQCEPGGGEFLFSSFGGSSLELRWEALSMRSWQVARKHQEAVQILTNVSGCARSGKLTCILGPSGAGKSTLLNVLAGRQSGGQRHRIRITGQVWVSGQKVDPRAVRSRIAYVMQKDEMFATSTPQEALSFSASLRLSGPREDRQELISELLGSLGLLGCANTYIGNTVINGLSGGQRKRTAIGAVELITRPDIVCLDEPPGTQTSGLDSYAAYQEGGYAMSSPENLKGETVHIYMKVVNLTLGNWEVMSVLKDLAKTGCTIICASAACEQNCKGLCGGHCLWAGDREQMVNYFAKVGYPCPAGFNPADFVIFLMQTDPPEPKAKTDALVRIWTQERLEAALQRSSASGLSVGPVAAGLDAKLCRALELLLEGIPRLHIFHGYSNFTGSPEEAKPQHVPAVERMPSAVVNSLLAAIGPSDLPPSQSQIQQLSKVRKSFGKQLRQLAKREFRAVVRDRTTLTVRFCLSVVLTFLFGLVFQGVGRGSQQAEAGRSLKPTRLSKAIATRIFERRNQPCQSIFDQMWTGLTYEEVDNYLSLGHSTAKEEAGMVFLREYSSGTYSRQTHLGESTGGSVSRCCARLGLCYVVMPGSRLGASDSGTDGQIEWLPHVTKLAVSAVNARSDERFVGISEADLRKLIGCCDLFTGLSRNVEAQGNSGEIAEAFVRNVRSKTLVWIKTLAVLLYRGGTPISKDFVSAADLGGSRRVGKGRRPSTLRKHVKTWEKFVLWLKGAYDVEWPVAPQQFIDYLEERASEPCGKSVPLALLKTLMFMETSAEILKPQQISVHPSVSNAMQEIARFLESASHSETRKANMLPVKVVMALERTKTTGPGKSVKTVKLYVSKDAWLEAPTWLSVGWEIWEELTQEAGLARRDFLLPVPASDLQSITKKVASYADAAALSKALLSNLGSCEGKGHLLLPGLAAMWTEHSERATLRTWAGAIPLSPQILKRLGRWKQSVDEGYDRGDRGEVEKAQAKIAKFIRTSRGKADPVDEEGLLSKIVSRLVDQGFEPSVAAEQLVLLSYFGRDTAPAASDSEELRSASDSATDVISSSSENEDAAPARKPPSPAQAQGKFFVSIVGRSKQRQLGRTEGENQESSSSDSGVSSSDTVRNFATLFACLLFCILVVAFKCLCVLLHYADFPGLAQTKGIKLKQQAELAQLSILAISRYSAVADDRAGLRTFCKDILHLDPSTTPEHLVEVAALLDLWESCKSRAEAQHKADAEAVLSKLPRVANKSELQDIKSRFEALHYALDDKATPSSATLEFHFDQVEQGELRPTTLGQYVSREHAEAEQYGAVIDKSTGAIKIKKGFTEGKKPTSPEEFRSAVKLVAHTWVMCFLRYPQKSFLKDVSVAQWQRYADYMLGEHVHGLTAKDSQGHDLSSPSWDLVLAYDYQIRRGMVRLINEGSSFATALDSAMRDTVIKERYFVTPCALASISTSPPTRSRSPNTRGFRNDGFYGDQVASASVGASPAEVQQPQILYLFSGSSRATSTTQLLKKSGMNVCCVDISEGSHCDLSLPEVQERILRQIQKRMYRVILCTPPCSTWSRARCANKRGPPPVRDAAHPDGYPWLKASRAQEAWLGSQLVQFAIRVFQLATEASEQHPDSPCFLLWEHPEDLGVCVREEDRMHIQPASVWQLAAVRNLIDRGHPPVFTVAFNQCCFGASYRKPTRVLSNLPALRSWGPSEWPLLDDDGFYLGPLQPSCACRVSMTLARTPQDLDFPTVGTAAYPPRLDSAISSAVKQALKAATFPSDGVGTCLQGSAGAPLGASSQTAGKGCSASEVEAPGTAESPDVGSLDDQGNLQHLQCKSCWGRGPPIMAWYKGSSRPICDGGGLLSPGRWPIHRRDLSLSDKGEQLRALVHDQFRLWREAVVGSGKDVMRDKFWPAAAGSITVSPFGESIDSAREAVDTFLEQVGLDPRRRPEDVESEVNFRRVAAAAEVLGDVDFDYLQEVASQGVPIGVGVELPRTPHVFEPKVKWNLSEAEGEFVDTKAENYSSARESMARVREQVLEDVKKGLVERMTKCEAESEFKGRLAIAALGAVPKALDSDEVRVVHDGSYSVDVNHRIRVRDRIRNPLVDDAEAVMRQVKEECSARPGIRFGMVYDVAHAHRLMPVRRQDWGYQAFSLDDSDEVFLHKRGAFGIASAAYWWQRLAATLIRCFHLLAGLIWAVYHLLYADDGWLVAQGSDFGFRCLFWMFLFDLFEVPLSWRKVRGGVRLQWIGYELSLDAFQVGISERKRQWILNWVDTVLMRGGITGRDLRSALGRLVFVAGALRHVRPFLGTLFAWSSVLAAGTCASFPLGVRLVLELIKQEVGGCRMTNVCEWPRYPVDCFRIDAKAERDDIVLGGWETLGGKSTENARWYSIRLSRSNAPWAFVKGEPFRTIAALELTAVLIAVILFSKFGSLRGRFAAGALPALTDSKVSAHVIDKYLSCSFPLSVVLMEVSLQLHQMNTRLMLRWVPREQNTEADALTNENFHGFREENRIDVRFEEIEFLVLSKLMEAAQDVDAEVRLKKSKRHQGSSYQDEPGRRRKKGETRWKDPW
ncbi:Abcg1 [Symbiodinium natans]|uniref:Abcg1 protein n=1 Tax=Symbiodinium natans TaxID=878477 RepID=A0A812MJ79_9DINO|nr:Abcg1 [Symbiodinium natans]